MGHEGLVSAIREAINSRKWQAAHNVMSLGGVWKLWTRSGRQIDARGFRSAIAASLPDSHATMDEIFELVFRSLDVTGGGKLSYSTFVSVFTSRNRPRGEPPAAYHAALPTWGEAVGGYIPKNEKSLTRAH